MNSNSVRPVIVAVVILLITLVVLSTAESRRRKCKLRVTYLLSTDIQVSDINRHLFADCTLLGISLRPENINEVMCALYNAFNSISNWISANLLALNPTKT